MYCNKQEANVSRKYIVSDRVLTVHRSERSLRTGSSSISPTPGTYGTVRRVSGALRRQGFAFLFCCSNTV